MISDTIPSDGRAVRFPVSVKGVVFFGEEVVLLENERQEWELPGGKIEPGEQPGPCVVREIAEELGIEVSLAGILDSWMYDIQGQVEVLIVTYLCVALSPRSALRCSHEHKRLGLFDAAGLAELTMPEGYRASIRRAALQRTA